MRHTNCKLVKIPTLPGCRLACQSDGVRVGIPNSWWQIGIPKGVYSLICQKQIAVDHQYYNHAICHHKKVKPLDSVLTRQSVGSRCATSGRAQGRWQPVLALQDVAEYIYIYTSIYIYTGALGGLTS